MLVALKSLDHIHIDRMSLYNTTVHSHLIENEMGTGYIRFVRDMKSTQVYWSDSEIGRISYADYNIMKAHTFRARTKQPYAIAMLEDDLFWTELKSNTIRWSHRNNTGRLKHFNIAVDHNWKISYSLPTCIPIIATYPALHRNHPCQRDNDGCSHICIATSALRAKCLCPNGWSFQDKDNKTCSESEKCAFRCKTGECLSKSKRCDGRHDCPGIDISDEEDCDPIDITSNLLCSFLEFSCHNDEKCIELTKRCDGNSDCQDNSDEMHCENYGQFIYSVLFSYH